MLVIAIVFLPSWGLAEYWGLTFDNSCYYYQPEYPLNQIEGYNNGPYQWCMPNNIPQGLEHHYLPPKVIVIEKNPTQTDELNGLFMSMPPENNYQYTPPTDYYLYDQTSTLPEQPYDYYDPYGESYNYHDDYCEKGAPKGFENCDVGKSGSYKYFNFDYSKYKKAD